MMNNKIDYLFFATKKHSFGAIGSKRIFSKIPFSTQKIRAGIPSDVDSILKKMIRDEIEIKNILFGNVVTCSDIMRRYLVDKGISVTSYELGWFPHYKTTHFDPLGFSDKSLLAKSRLDNVPDIKCDLKLFKKQKIIHPLSNKQYILLVLQDTNDSTIVHGYPDFKNWQTIINFANSLKLGNEILAIKMHPKNIKHKIKIDVPKNAIKITSTHTNHDLLENANLVIGVNSTMLYEASLLYDKPVLALGNSWFDAHPEVAKKVKITDRNIDRPIVNVGDIKYRRKMFHIMMKMQMPSHKNVSDNADLDYICRFLKHHDKISKVKKITDLLKDDG